MPVAMRSVLAVLVLVVVLLGVAGAKEEASLQHTQTLADGRITFSWDIVGDKLEAEVSWSGPDKVLGLGFSPKGGMQGADILLLWVGESGIPNIVDCHCEDEAGAPSVDESQDVDALSARRNNSVARVRFQRLLDTCDEDDLALGNDTVRVIWSLHEASPQFEGGRLLGLLKHKYEDRGTQSLHLGDPPLLQKTTYTKTWDVTLTEYVIPDNMDTVYRCKIFKAPILKEKNHIVGYEPILSHGNEALIHHMVLYQCGGKAGNLLRYVPQESVACYGPEMPGSWEPCLTPVVAWAIGSRGEFLPSHVGLPFTNSTFFMLEIHYANPAYKKVTDNSGLRIHYTDKLRQHDAGIMVNGVTITPLHFIPQEQEAFHTAGYCNSACTNEMIPKPGIKIVSVVLHSHRAGRAIRLRHMRGGNELSPIVGDDHYDFDYQQSRTLPMEVSVLPGDELITECIYDTIGRKQPTFGGFSTKQEMCLSFILYYPKMSLAVCDSMTPVKYFLETFNVQEFYGVDMDTVERMFLKTDQSENLLLRLPSTTSTTPLNFPSLSPDNALDEVVNANAISALKKMKDFTEEGVESGTEGGLFGELVIREPEGFRNHSLLALLLEQPWDDPLITQPLQRHLYSGEHMVFCRNQEDELSVPADIYTFPNISMVTLQGEKLSPRCNDKRKYSRRPSRSSCHSCFSFVSLVTWLTICLLLLR